MIVDVNHENFQEMRLYNEVMGIALAVWGNAGDCPFFRFIDRALDNFNEEAMRIVKQSFDMLPENMQAEIMSEHKSENTIAAIERFSRYTFQLAERIRSRSA